MSPQFLLVPGAGGAAWYWHLVEAELAQQGYPVIAVDLPGDDEGAGLIEYAELIVEAGQGRDELVLVGQSMGGFSVPIAAEQLRPSRIVLLNAMIPVPDETAAEWGEHVGSTPARIAAAEAGGYSTDFVEDVYFFHDLPPAVLEAGAEHVRLESGRAFSDRCRFAEWAAPVTVLAGREDRLFPLEFQRKVARDRLGVPTRVVPGGHLAALSHPVDIAAALVSSASSARQ